MATPLEPSAELFEAHKAKDFAARPQPRWLVDKLIPEKSITLLMGKSQARKSFMSIELGACVASGRDFLKRPVMRRPVIYVALEDSFDLALRIEAATNHLSEEDCENFIVSESVVTLPKNRAGFDDFEKFLSRHPGSLVILDTYAYFNDGDINSPADSAEILRTLRGLIQKYEVTIVLVCHPAQKEDARPMGAINLFNSVACVLGVKETAAPLVSSVTILKCKGARKGDTFNVGFELFSFPDGTSTLKVSDGKVDPLKIILQRSASEAGRRAALKGEQAREAILAALKASPTGLTHGELEAQSCGDTISEGTFEAARRTLYENGAIEKTEGGRWRLKSG